MRRTNLQLWGGWDMELVCITYPPSNLSDGMRRLRIARRSWLSS